MTQEFKKDPSGQISCKHREIVEGGGPHEKDYCKKKSNFYCYYNRDKCRIPIEIKSGKK